MEKSKGRVCVTGGTGFIGSWIIKNLLQDGYSVNTTVRSNPEKAVLEFGEQNGLDVVTLVPTFVLGPFICPKLPSSVHASLSLAFGDKGPFGWLLQAPMVHVDDVARAHTFLLEHPNPKGRYNCSSSLVTVETISQIVSFKYPEFQLSMLE
ncbi:hypothetical protein PIB30_070427 [Stylosanthes scabra]|uniref:NAD-dependent epimerase/dehydratase domain-containing protein n=1 Tax=Stylosanthes scabra TaxID=79078 RepID=A0ABU6QP87_9FABA|nr:hypothetical protein [Stylosanthes scabra]